MDSFLIDLVYENRCSFGNCTFLIKYVTGILIDLNKLPISSADSRANPNKHFYCLYTWGSTMGKYLLTKIKSLKCEVCYAG